MAGVWRSSEIWRFCRGRNGQKRWWRLATASKLCTLSAAVSSTRRFATARPLDEMEFICRPNPPDLRGLAGVGALDACRISSRAQKQDGTKPMSDRWPRGGMDEAAKRNDLRLRPLQQQ